MLFFRTQRFCVYALLKLARNSILREKLIELGLRVLSYFGTQRPNLKRRPIRRPAKRIVSSRQSSSSSDDRRQPERRAAHPSIRAGSERSPPTEPQRPSPVPAAERYATRAQNDPRDAERRPTRAPAAGRVRPAPRLLPPPQPAGGSNGKHPGHAAAGDGAWPNAWTWLNARPGDPRCN